MGERDTGLPSKKGPSRSPPGLNTLTIKIFKRKFLERRERVREESRSRVYSNKYFR